MSRYSSDRMDLDRVASKVLLHGTDEEGCVDCYVLSAASSVTYILEMKRVRGVSVLPDCV